MSHLCVASKGGVMCGSPTSHRSVRRASIQQALNHLEVAALRCDGQRRATGIVESAPRGLVGSERGLDLIDGPSVRSREAMPFPPSS